ncbi:uncharacterized protein LOC131215503 [Anopheles bellator]|uniref:uncharacterized protein LOC131215503 n=1 Tax=Anopheles bellator TaxID=139047 RepID=UPI002649B203|nr:uncharacterized protein LOC131215503 [Anopheles bellator]
MDNPADDDEFVVESSQAPTLRSNVRKDRISYAAYLPRPRQRKPRQRKDRQKPPLKKNSPNLNDLNKHNFVETNPTSRNAPEETLILMSGTSFPTASAPLKARSTERIDRCPSLDLFQHQEQQVSRYIFHQTASVQQEEQDLDRLLDGFKASYDVVSKRVTSTPYHSTADRTTNDRPSLMESLEIASDAQELHLIGPPYRTDQNGIKSTEIY